MLSIIIPSYKEPHLNKTIEDLLTKAAGDIEITITLDGYWCEPIDDPRVKYIHLGQRRGMREGINAAASLSRGEYLLKTDAHCIFGKGFDTVLTGDCEKHDVCIPRRFFLDTEKWEVMDVNPIDYEKMLMHRERYKFTSEEWRSRAKARNDILYDETMAMQGSCWCMRKKHWDEVIKKLDTENYGPFVQEPTEIGMLTFKNGGRLMVNKKTWYAHKHRKFNRSHNVSPQEQEKGNTYAINLWKDEWEKLKVRFGI